MIIREGIFIRWSRVHYPTLDSEEFTKVLWKGGLSYDEM